MAHIKLKPTKSFKINFTAEDLQSVVVPDESKKVAQDYLKSDKLADGANYDLMFMYGNNVLFGFDYSHQKTKRLIIEINPVTIFYSNAVMSSGTLIQYKDLLLRQAQDITKIGIPGEELNLTHSNIYFQLAINTIINLQAALESFANRVIPKNYPYLNKYGEKIYVSLETKLTNIIPKIKQITFQRAYNRKHSKAIKSLIDLRNDIVHLKPASDTNTGYKHIYRQLLDFDFDKTFIAVRTYINFYENGLLEECECGKNFSFYFGEDLDNKKAPQ